MAFTALRPVVMAAAIITLGVAPAAAQQLPPQRNLEELKSEAQARADRNGYPAHRPQARRGARGAGAPQEPRPRRMGGVLERDRRALHAEGANRAGERAGSGRQGFHAGVALLLLRALAGAELARQAAGLPQGARRLPRARQAARPAARGAAHPLRGQRDRGVPADAEERAAGAGRRRHLRPRQPQGGHGRAFPADAGARRRLCRRRHARHRRGADQDRAGRRAHAVAPHRCGDRHARDRQEPRRRLWRQLRRLLVDDPGGDRARRASRRWSRNRRRSTRPSRRQRWRRRWPTRNISSTTSPPT